MFANKKILLVSHDLSRTGAPMVLLELAKYLISKHYAVDVWGLKSGDLYADFVNIGITPCITRGSRRAVRNLFIKTGKKYDYIICNTIETFKAVDVLQRFNIPTIWYIHESGYLEEMVQKNKDFKNVFEHFYNIYACSKYSAEICMRYNKVSDVHIIPNCTQDVFKSYRHHQEIRFGAIGAISELKGIDTLVDAFTALVSQEKNIKLYSAGDTNSDFAKMLMQKTKDVKQILWLGTVKDAAKRKFFDSVDVLCVPSVYDSAPISLLEGLMYGKPIITTVNVGNNNLVSKQTGFIIPIQDKARLYDAMDWFCKHKSRIPQMMKNARSQYLSGASCKNQEVAIDKMLKDNINKKPIVTTNIKYEVLEKNAPKHNVREIFLFGHKIFEYRKKKKH